jgi:hypothetical protein
MIVSGLTIANASQALGSKTPKDCLLGATRRKTLICCLKHPNLCLQCCPRSHQIDERPENQSAKIRHHAVTSADSPLLANWIGFTIGTGGVSIESDIRRMTALLKLRLPLPPSSAAYPLSPMAQV